jgi:hypothetical protein
MQKHAPVVILITLLLTACASHWPFSASRPKADGWTFNLDVTVIYATHTPAPSATLTPTATPSPTPTCTLPATWTAVPSPTRTPIPVTATPTPLPAPPDAISPPSNPPPSATTPAPLPVSAASHPVGGITLIELRDDITLPADVTQVEFKWVWEGHACAPPPDGQAFEIRIWPDLPGAVPLGIMDASQQDAIVCDSISGTRMVAVGNLREAPAFATSPSGRFGWYVALVDLEPQSVLTRSESRFFEVPAPAP